MARAWRRLRPPTSLTLRCRRVSRTNRFLRPSRMGRRARSCRPGGTSCQSRISRPWQRIFARSALRINLDKRRRRQWKAHSQRCTPQVTTSFSVFRQDDASRATVSTSILPIASYTHLLSRDPRWAALCLGLTISLFLRLAFATALPTSCQSAFIDLPVFLPGPFSSWPLTTLWTSTMVIHSTPLYAFLLRVRITSLGTSPRTSREYCREASAAERNFIWFQLCHWVTANCSSLAPSSQAPFPTCRGSTLFPWVLGVQLTSGRPSPCWRRLFLRSPMAMPWEFTVRPSVSPYKRKSGAMRSRSVSQLAPGRQYHSGRVPELNSWDNPMPTPPPGYALASI